MDNLMPDEIYMFCLVAACVSETITLLLILVHIWIPKLLKHPGQYILIQCGMQFLYDTHWMISYPSIRHKIGEGIICNFLGFLIMTSYNFGMLYAIVLGTEVIIKLKNIGSISYYRRSIAYHSTCIVLALIFDLFAIIGDMFGESNIGTCTLKPGVLNHIEIYLRFLLLSILVFILVRLIYYRRTRHSKIMLSYSLILFCIIITWPLPPIIGYFLTEKFSIYSSYILGSISGTLVGLARLFDMKIITEVYKKFLNSSQKKEFSMRKKKYFKKTCQEEFLIKSFSTYTEQNSDSISCFGELFEKMSKKIYYEIFILLSIHYKFREDFTSDIEEFSDQKIGFAYSPQKCTFLDKTLVQKQLSGCKEYLAPNMYFIEYRPKIFCKIRRHLGYTNDDIFKYILYSSINSQLNLAFHNAKYIENQTNNSIIYFTSDQKYVIKTICKDESVIFLKHMLRSYAKRIFECPESKIVRILGVYKIISSKINFILMENAAPLSENSLIFDLKGSSIDRFVPIRHEIETLESKVLKDENFKIIGKKVRMSMAKSKKILKILKDDMKTLRDLGIMDYSLLLIIHNVPNNTRYSLCKKYSIAIIDLFQLYDKTKALERWYKTYIRRVDRSMISVVSPNEYYERLANFVDTIFTEDEELELNIKF